jgi:hypothetical protein
LPYYERASKAEEDQKLQDFLLVVDGIYILSAPNSPLFVSDTHVLQLLQFLVLFAFCSPAKPGATLPPVSAHSTVGDCRAKSYQ